MTSECLESEDYDILKTTVIESYEQTKPELFERLSQKTTMTGRPSQYLRELQSLATKAGIGQCEDLIRHKFLDSLPKSISPAIAAQKTLTLSQLGSLADELMPMHKSMCYLTGQSTSQTEYSYKKSDNQNSSYQNKSYSLPSGLKPFSQNQKPKICRGHIYFADKSKTCKPWCRYPNKQGCNMEASSRPSSPNRHSENRTGGSN